MNKVPLTKERADAYHEEKKTYSFEHCSHIDFTDFVPLVCLFLTSSVRLSLQGLSIESWPEQTHAEIHLMKQRTSKRQAKPIACWEVATTPRVLTSASCSAADSPVEELNEKQSWHGEQVIRRGHDLQRAQDDSAGCGRRYGTEQDT